MPRDQLKSLMARYTGVKFGSRFKCSLEIGDKRYDGQARLSISDEEPHVAGVTFEIHDPSSQVIFLNSHPDRILEISEECTIPVWETEGTEGTAIGDGVPRWKGRVAPGRWFRHVDDLTRVKFSFADVPLISQWDDVHYYLFGLGCEFKEIFGFQWVGHNSFRCATAKRQDRLFYDDAFGALTSMTLALSFASGNYRMPVLVEGVRSDGTVSTAMAGKLHTNASSQRNWFSVHGSVDVASVAKAIMSIYASDGCHLRNVITKYVESELAFRGGAHQAAVAMAQSCLEALVKWETAGGKNADVLRDQCGRARKEAQIITDLLERRGFQFAEGEIRKLTDTRNQIIHADILIDGFTHRAYRVWNTMQFWSEAWFLSKLGLMGRVEDRRKCWAGETYQLPVS